jgi:hypothetical protein
MASPEHRDPRIADESAYDSEIEGGEGRFKGATRSSMAPQHLHREHGRSQSQRPEKHVRLHTEPTEPSLRGGEVDNDLERGVIENVGEEGVLKCKECIDGGKTKEKAGNVDVDKSGPLTQSQSQRILKSFGTLVTKVLFLESASWSWIPNNLTWSKIKPALRSALLGWVSLLFVIIPRLEVTLGQVRFSD